MSSVPTLFLSYSHLDKQLAARLAQDLSAQGDEVWIDDREMNVGDSIPLRIQEAIARADFFVVILSPRAMKSDWVQREIDLAFESSQVSGRPRILPVRQELCATPLRLSELLSADFIEPSLYRRGLTALLHAIHGKPRHSYLTAKEAARKVHATQHPKGGLCGLSQTGITQQYIGQKTMQAGDWVSADVKSGRSAIWIVDYYNHMDRTIQSYGVFDSNVTDFPLLHLQGTDMPRIIDFNYADSDIVVPAAVTRARLDGAIPNEKDFFALSRLRYYNQTDYIWYVMFLDESFTETTYVVAADARSGKVLMSGLPAEFEFKKEKRKMKTWSWGDPLKKLRRDLKNVKGLALDFDLEARELFKDKKARGLFEEIDVEVVLELVNDYEVRLERIVHRQILDEVERIGKLDEFEDVLASDLDSNAYLTYVIPEYGRFLRRAIDFAKGRI